MKTNVSARMAVLLGVLLAMLAGTVGPAGAAEPAPQPEPRIVGGTFAADGEFPSQAAIVARGATPSSGQFCGGTVIDRSWVLTAAHCVTDDNGGVRPASVMDVLVGTTDLRYGGTRIPVVQIRRHPSYNPNTLRSDVALLRLDRPVPDGTPIQALASPGGDPAAGADVVTVGWGDLGDGTYPNELRKVTLDMRSQTSCTQQNSPHFDAATMVCAWRSGKSDCYGDSGGPLYETRGGVLVQVGVVSWGFECGVYDSVYARVSALSTWIRTQIRYGPQPDATAFVRRQHLDLFGRQPTDTELYTGVAGLGGGQSPSAYVAGLLDGSTYRNRAGGVIRLYQAIFLRSPETGGMGFWMGEANRGVSLKRIADLMVRAEEFEVLYGPLADAAFVDLVYANVLGRPASDQDRTFWTSELTSGRRTRGQVMVGFSESAEYRSAYDSSVRVIGAFHALLRRVPTGAEVVQWTGHATSGITTALLTSYAYAARF